jgi:hypothetical protein
MIERCRRLGFNVNQFRAGQTQGVGQLRREVVGFVLTGFSQGYAFEFAERFFHACSLCNNQPSDWGFSVGIGLRRLSGAFVFALTERP